MSKIRIHVKTGHGEPITMEVQKTDTIIGIKDKIFKEHQIPHDEQHIVFADSRADSKGSGADDKSDDLSDIPKLEDAKLAGTEYSEKCTLILTEGDSAKAFVMMGLTAFEKEKRELYGVFPLRGKPPNARNESVKKNNVISHLTRILGLNNYDTEDKTDEEDIEIYKSMRYGNVLLMMDQDYDGSHIKGLMINLIRHMWPKLVLTKNFHLLSQFTTPIVKATHVNSEDFIPFYTIQAFKEWEGEQNNDLSSWTIKYYKGLGSSSDDEAIDCFKNMDRNKKIFTWEDHTDTDAIDVAFQKKKQNVEDRKRWISGFKSDNYLEIQDNNLRFKEFINKEYILYAIANLKRSIPHIMDGLVPAQRKILYGSFKKNLIKDIKVNQFIGYVSEECAYHHDEGSLSQTLIRMAQKFVGANNINLFMPSGQYGTRNLCGKDHASPRYLTTNLNSITRCLFPNVDDELLEYVNEDGKFVEPKWFLPVIPMVLVNGSRGIGVGWSSHIPKYNPRDIVENIRRKFANEPLKEMTPWYKNFNGTLKKYKDKDKWGYVIHGLVDYDINNHTCHIKELPVGKSIEGYYKFLKSRSIRTEKNNDPLIKDFKKIGDARTVGFHVEFNPGSAPLNDGDLIEMLGLKTQISMDDMYLYGIDGQIKKFDSAEKILDEFYEARLVDYDRRKKKMEINLQSRWMELRDTIHFVKLVRDQKFDFFKKDSKELQNYFTNLGVTAVRPEESTGCEYGVYQSLLSLPLSTFFDEGLKKLEVKQSETKAEMDAVSKKINTQMWDDDLTTFLTEWDKQEGSSNNNVMDQQENQIEETIDNQSVTNLVEAELLEDEALDDFKDESIAKRKGKRNTMMPNKYNECELTPIRKGGKK